MSQLTREQWLLKLADKYLIPFIAKQGREVPKYRVSIGFPRGGKGGRGKVIGQCWSADASTDKTREIFISPLLSDPAEIAETLLHELLHAALPDGTGHKGDFIVLAKAVGFNKPWTSTPATDELRERVKDWLMVMPELPHAAMVLNKVPKQGTRMLKAECSCCGYVVRLTRKWAEVGLPSCPNGTEMELQ